VHLVWYRNPALPTCTSPGTFRRHLKTHFTARRYTSAVLAVTLQVSACVCYYSEFMEAAEGIKLIFVM